LPNARDLVHRRAQNTGKNTGTGSCEEIVSRSNYAIAKLASVGKLRM
jgi:hypothetical protein